MEQFRLSEIVMGATSSQPTRFKFTRDSVEGALCAPGKSQALFWDTDQPGLGLRVTAGGARSFIFESRLGGKTVRITIGPASMSIRAPRDKTGRPLAPGANVEAARLASLVAQGIDPRADKAATIARQEADRAVARLEREKLGVSGLDAWAVYMADRRPQWRPRTHLEHERAVGQGGREWLRREGRTTRDGVLRVLLDRPLAEIDQAAVEAFLRDESKSRPTQAALGFRMLRAFMRWCAESAEFREIVQADAWQGKRIAEAVRPVRAKDDVIQREQLRAWFAAVRKQPAVPSAYLQVLLLTGARREEIAALRWEDVDFRWGSLRLADKVDDGGRTIPLTPYVAAVLRQLERSGEVVEIGGRKKKRPPWVFASGTAVRGYVSAPDTAHRRALAAAGLPHVSLHGLRRSFGSLSEWVECPAGVVAQIQGHRPSGTAEKHYRVRSLDLLRLWHSRIEAWVLTEAGIEQPKPEEAEKPAPLRVIGR